MFNLLDPSNISRSLTADQNGKLLYDSAPLATEALLTSKQDTLTTGAGAFLSGATLSGYDLRWQGGAPSIGGGIRCIHFRAGLVANEVYNVSTGQNDYDLSTEVSNSSLSVALADMATITWANTQFQPMLDSVTQTGAHPNMTTTFGTKLTEFGGNFSQNDCKFTWATGSSTVFANASYWGWIPTAGQTFRMYAPGLGPALEISPTAVEVNMPGALNVAGTKNFLIPHPNTALVPDEGKAWKLRHTAIESDKPYLMYRMTVDMTSSTQTVQMSESWFPHIVKDICVHMSPYKHFGSGWGELATDGFTVTLHVSTVGQWNILITGVRNDECGRKCADAPIEFQEDIPPPDNHQKVT